MQAELTDEGTQEKPYPSKHCAEAKALDMQEGGGHYKSMKIQYIEFVHANNIPVCEAAAIKYLCRWRNKGGVEDLKKAKHSIDLLIQLEGL